MYTYLNSLSIYICSDVLLQGKNIVNCLQTVFSFSFNRLTLIVKYPQIIVGIPNYTLANEELRSFFISILKISQFCVICHLVNGSKIIYFTNFNWK